MEVLNVNEHKDGSATLSIDCTDKEVEFLVSYAIKDILKKSINNMDFNPKDYIYDGSSFPCCMGQSDGGRRCPVCGISTNSMLPTSWYEGHEDHLRTHHAFFCKEHGPKELEWNKAGWEKKQLFKDIMDKRKEQEEVVYTDAVIVVNGQIHKVKAYDIDMTAGTVVGFIEDDTRIIDGYTNYKISIPTNTNTNTTNCDWSFPVTVVRIDETTLKFYTPGEA